MASAGILFLIYFIPVFTIGFNAWKIIIYYRRTSRFIQVPGHVIGIDVQTASAGRSGRASYFAPVVEYTTRDHITFKGVYSEDNPDRSLYTVGEKVTICYDPAAPGKFIIYDPKAEYLVSAVWIAVGVGAGYVIFWYSLQP